MSSILASPLAGSWYQADPGRLRAEVQGFLARAEYHRLADLRALILPHAGYRYSGAIAGIGVRQAVGRDLARIIVLGPSHRQALPDAVAMSDASHFSTPLGDIPLDHAALAVMRAQPGFRLLPALHGQEHSIHIQLPLLQAALGQFRLVPLVVGRCTPTSARILGQGLAGLLDASTLVVVSTDFTHHGPRFSYEPFHDRVQERIQDLDQQVFAAFASREPARLQAILDQTGATVCGAGPLLVVQSLLRPEHTVTRLAYDTSARIAADGSPDSVSYLAAAITGAPLTPAGRLAPATGQALLVLARRAMEFRLAHGRDPRPEELSSPTPPEAEVVMGAFVTLKRDGRLRGCIGEIQPRRALRLAVIEQALNAAFRDPRFPPLEQPELPHLHLDLTALHPPRPVSSWQEIVLGRDGIILRKDGRSATFLPQVAPEQGWDLATTLSHLASKAGLTAEAWRTGATFEVYAGEVFSEADRR